MMRLAAALLLCAACGGTEPHRGSVQDLTGKWDVSIMIDGVDHAGCVLDMETYHSGLWSCSAGGSVPTLGDVGTQARPDSVTLHVLGEAMQADVALEGDSHFAGYFWTTTGVRVNGRIKGSR